MHLYHHPFPTRRSSDLLPIDFIQDTEILDIDRIAKVGRYLDFTKSPAVVDVVQLNVRLRIEHRLHGVEQKDRKSTRLNSSHLVISYAVSSWKKTVII